MLPMTVTKRLEQLPKVSRAGKRVNGLYRLAMNPTLWETAYAKIATNRGAMTPGVDGRTFDGFSLETIRTHTRQLGQGTYAPMPVRRVHIPKTNGKLRPLGIPTANDRLVQEVIRALLERVYEPVFSEHSHGFRPNRSCHTALKEIQATWTGVKWLVEVDIAGYFDSMDHGILIDLLAEKIGDRRFLDLIRKFLKAGYLEKDWKFHQTYSGTPQGGVVSPLLANVYLHQLDLLMEKEMAAFNKGRKRRGTPAAKRRTRQLYQVRRRIDRRRHEGADEEEIAQLFHELDRLTKEGQREPYGDPFDPNFRRLRYVRYADDFLIGVIGSKADARQIMAEVRHFLTHTLKLSVSEEKSGIRKASDGVEFLGYQIRTCTAKRTRRVNSGPRRVTKRTVTDRMQLAVPYGRMLKFCANKGYGNLDSHECKQRPTFLRSSDLEIVTVYNAEIRGFANFYALAGDAKPKLGRLHYVWRGSLLKTLAGKHGTTVSRTLKKLRIGRDLAVRYKVEGGSKSVRVWKMMNLKTGPSHRWEIDKIPPGRLELSRTDIIDRLHARKCEYCGQTGMPCQVHHVRKLADMQRGSLKWLRAARQRRRVVLCVPCHFDLHGGRLPDRRSGQQAGVESRVS